MKSKGTLKFWNARRGYGFIQPQEGGKDLFMHASAARAPTEWAEGDTLEYDVATGKRGLQAADAVRVGGAAKASNESAVQYGWARDER